MGEHVFKYKKIKNYCIEFLLRYYWMIFLLLAGLFFIKKIGIALLVITLIIVGGLSYLYRIFIPISLGIELITPFTFLISFITNPFTGWVAASIMILISAFLSRRVCYYTVIKIAIYGIICLLFAILVSSFGFLTTGKILVVILNILFIAANMIFHDVKTVMDLPGNVINVIFVWALLGWIGGFV